MSFLEIQPNGIRRNWSDWVLWPLSVILCPVFGVLVGVFVIVICTLFGLLYPWAITRQFHWGSSVINERAGGGR